MIKSLVIILMVMLLGGCNPGNTELSVGEMGLNIEGLGLGSIGATAVGLSEGMDAPGYKPLTTGGTK